MKTKTHLAKRLDTRSTALAIMKVSGGILIQPKSESKQLSGCVSGLILKAPTLEVSSFLKKKNRHPQLLEYIDVIHIHPLKNACLLLSRLGWSFKF